MYYNKLNDLLDHDKEYPLRMIVIVDIEVEISYMQNQYHHLKNIGIYINKYLYVYFNHHRK